MTLWQPDESLFHANPVVIGESGLWDGKVRGGIHVAETITTSSTDSPVRTIIVQVRIGLQKVDESVEKENVKRDQKYPQ